MEHTLHRQFMVDWAQEMTELKLRNELKEIRELQKLGSMCGHPKSERDDVELILLRALDKLQGGE